MYTSGNRLFILHEKTFQLDRNTEMGVINITLHFNPGKE